MRKIDLDNLPKPCNYFDLIGGTRTGRYLQIALVRLYLGNAADTATV